MFLRNMFLLPDMVGESVFYEHISGFEPFFLILKCTLSSIFHEILYNKRSNVRVLTPCQSNNFRSYNSELLRLDSGITMPI